MAQTVFDFGLHVVCPYYTMFPIGFPQRQLRRAGTGDWVLDPFCGRGTTLFAARAAGLPSVGVDSSPVAAAIAEAKLCWSTPDQVVAEGERILAETPEPENIPAGEFWKMCFHPDTLRALCVIREALVRDCRSDARKLLRALLLGRLHGPLRKASPSYLSNQMPRTYASKPAYAVRFWRERSLEPPRVDLLDLVRRSAPLYFGAMPPRVGAGGGVHCGDARTISLSELGGPFAWTITSPPYYGMRTYVPDQWLRYWFLGGPDQVAYDFEGQLSHRSPEDFVGNLGMIWRRIAEASGPGARLVVRFGGIHDRKSSPKRLMMESLRASSRWRLTTVVSAGTPARARRQANQFSLTQLKQPVEEADYHAVLVD